MITKSAEVSLCREKRETTVHLRVTPARAAALAILFSFGFAALPSALAQNQCTVAADACFDRADTAFSACYERCTSNSCFNRCDDRFDLALDACDSEEIACNTRSSPPQSSAASPSRPAMAQGNGCYLGECPDDTPAPPPSPRPGTSSPQPQVTQAIEYSWVCQTPAYWCTTANGAWPVGSACWCSNAIYGAAIGQIIPQR